MSARFTSRVTAVLISGLLVAGSITATAPAFADEIVEPTPISTETAAPEAPAEEPAAEPTIEPTEEPAAEPSEEPTVPDDATESGSDGDVEADGDAANSGSVELTGYITETSHHDSDGTTELFRVSGLGLVRLDFAGVDLGPSSLKSITVKVAVPTDLELGSTEESEFEALSAYALAGAALPVIEVVGTSLLKPTVKGMVNQTPAATAVHKVYAVPVTPANMAGSAPTTAQGSAVIQANVAHSNTYWNSQSDGKVSFALAGVTTWSKSPVSCAVSTDSNADNLWAQAATRAATELGYEDAPNNHLVLIFPANDGTPCGGPIGLGTVGYGINSGGYLWTSGGDTLYEKATLAHELGHNLSFGHADWLDCTSATPNPGFWGTTGCTTREYGDAADIMGYGMVGSGGGSLSSAHAIRSGMWSTGSYSVAPQGTTTHTLNALSTATGKRSVVVEDTTGVNYFIEFRDTTGIDAPFASYGCVSSSCAAPTAGVRVSRLEQQSFGGYTYKGIFTDASQLVGRTVSGVKKLNYGVGESFSVNGMTISVSAISGTTATVSVTRAANAAVTGWVEVNRIEGSNMSADDLLVGDTLIGLLSASWEADSYKFQWYRNGAAISGATKQSYVLSSSDLKKHIRVKVTSTTKGSTARTSTDPSTYYLGYGPIKSGVLNQGTVSINAATLPLTATPAGWATPGTAFTYQWLRNGVAITGAIKSTYSPSSTDNGKLLSVKVTAKKSGFNTLTATSAAKDYTVTGAGSVVVTGTAQVGKTLGITNTMTYATTAGAVASPILTYQWYRDTTAISGATGANYTLTSADYATALSVKVTARAIGYGSHSITSAKTVKAIKGDIAGARTAPVVTKTPGTLALTVALPGGSVTELGTKNSYQWYRGTTAITGAIKSTYTLTSSDRGKDVKVRVIVSKSNYTSVTLYSAAKNYSVTTASPTSIVGTAVVASTIMAPSLVFTTSDGAASPTVTRQWYRDGVAVSGKTGETYTLTSTDYGKYITVKTTASLPGYISYSATSPKSAKVGKGVLTGSKLAPVLTQTGMTLTGALPVGSYTNSGITVSYQWYRGTSAISKATKASYTLTSSDYNKDIKLRVIVAKSYYTSETRYSNVKNYSVVATPTAPVITGTVAQGNTLAIGARAYVANGVDITGTATLLHQWYRSGVAIPGATANTYTLAAADLGKVITVKVTASSVGYLSSVATSAATQKIGANALAGHSDFVFFSNTINPATNTVTAGSTGITEPGVTLAYQWYRGTSAIALATKSSYKLTSSDYNKEISVRVTTSKSGYTSVVKHSFKVNYSVIATGKPIISDTTPVRGIALSVTLPSYTATGLAYTPDPSAVTYQWYRSGVAISGTAAKQPTYTPVTADKTKTLSVKVTVSKPGNLSSATTSVATSKVP